MNYLIIGGLSKLGLNYINFYSTRVNINFICLGEDESYLKYSSTNPDANKNITYIIEPITINLLENIFKNHNIDKVINFHELEDNNYTKEEYYKTNFEFVVKAYELSCKHNVKHFTHLSTVKVYGNNFSYSTEQTKCIATCSYTDSKIKADEFLQTKDNTSILRVCDMFGKIYGDYFIDNIIQSILNDYKIVIHEESDFIRSYIDVLDVVYIFHEITSNNMTGIYNISSDFYINAKGIIDLFKTKFEIEDNDIIYKEDKLVSISCIKSDNSKVTNLLKYKIELQNDKFEFYLNNVLYQKRILKIKKEQDSK